MSTQVYAHAKAPTKSSLPSQQKGLLQRRATDPKQAAPATVPPVVHSVLNSPGQPLDASTRAFMEPRFGHDFSRVRVHTDERAAESAQAVNADAYTMRDHVVFGAGQYAPGTDTGQRLLAHELTHVVQQAAGPVAGTPFAHGLAMSDPADNFERAADHTVESVMSGAPTTSVMRSAQPRPTPASSGNMTIQRQKTASPTKEAQQQTTPVANMLSEEDAWNMAKGNVRSILENIIQGYGRAAAVDAKYQVRDLFSSYDPYIKAPNKTFKAVAGSFMSMVGNAPNDPNAPPERAISFTGAAAGLVGGVASALLDTLLDTDSVDDVKETANLDIEEQLIDELSPDTLLYNIFENAAYDELQPVFNYWWEHYPPEERNLSAATTESNFLQRYARAAFGLHSERGEEVLRNLSSQVTVYLRQKVQPQLEEQRRKFRERRLNLGVGLGAVGGGILGAVLGGTFGGLGGALLGTFLGAGVGLLAGFISGGGLSSDKAPPLFAGGEESRSERRARRVRDAEKLLREKRTQ